MNLKNKILYHGSRQGLIGNIKPESRLECDFGKGFYMGTKPMQAKTLVYNEESPVFYTINFHLENIPESRILTLSEMEWAFYVLYNRGKLKTIKDTDFYKKIADMDTDKDVIIGPIADDNMHRSIPRVCGGDPGFISLPPSIIMVYSIKSTC